MSDVWVTRGQRELQAGTQVELPLQHSNKGFLAYSKQFAYI